MQESLEEVDSSDPAFLEINEEASIATLDLLPRKSRTQYQIAYNKFVKWCQEKGVSGSYTENIFLAYFAERAKVWQSSTLWANYSMIKAMLRIDKNVDISKHYKLIAYLKRQAEGYRPKKSNILTSSQIEQFLKCAPDNEFLFMKVAAILGIFGACRREELCQMTLDNVEDMGTSLIINIPDTKNKVPRTFTVLEKLYLDLYRRYTSLRPTNVGHRRLFLKYVNGKCTRNPVGINSFGKIPSTIARYLQLPNPLLYTGHCFRRSSASLLANAGANLTTIKRHGGWRSSAVAEGYIEDSLENKNSIARKILPVQTTAAVASTSSTSTDGNAVVSIQSLATEGAGSLDEIIRFSNCVNNNCIFNISINK